MSELSNFLFSVWIPRKISVVVTRRKYIINPYIRKVCRGRPFPIRMPIRCTLKVCSLFVCVSLYSQKSHYSYGNSVRTWEPLVLYYQLSSSNRGAFTMPPILRWTTFVRDETGCRTNKEFFLPVTFVFAVTLYDEFHQYICYSTYILVTIGWFRHL